CEALPRKRERAQQLGQRMNRVTDLAPVGLRAVLVRATLLFGVWLIIAGIAPRDVLVGALATVAATWASLRLLPPGQWRLRPVALARLVFRFLWQSIYAGIDVAMRALDPRLPLRPGFVVFPARIPLGPRRDAFCTMTSLLPGTLPVDSGPARIVFHCLDV